MSSQRLGLVTLGVADLGRSREFYEAWGWQAHYADDNIVFFQLNGVVLGLFGLDALAADQARPGATLGTGAITLAQNFSTRDEVDHRFEAALTAGATVLKRPQAAGWGGYSGYFADPDGHVWELAMNPGWPVSDDGSVHMPSA